MGPELPVPQKVVDYVTRHETISVEEVMQDLDVSRTTAKNYLSRLVKMDIVKRIGRGLYQVGKGATATIRLTPELSLLANEIRKRFPMAQFTMWSVNMLADYAHYALGRDLIVLETDRILSASIRDALIERGYRTILNPEKRDFREYAYSSEKTIFILERNEKYGLFEIDGTSIPTPERVWLDIYYLITRKELSFSPSELGLIFANMLRKEGVNFNRSTATKKRSLLEARGGSSKTTKNSSSGLNSTSRSITSDWMSGEETLWGYRCTTLKSDAWSR